MRNSRTQRMVLSALFLALGLILPFITMQIRVIGNMLCPMHIPVMLCGFICGPFYGMAVGFITPLLRSVLFGMPAMMPSAVCMAFELAVYGLVTGILYDRLSKTLRSIYIALIAAMISGRVVWGLVSIFVYRALGNVFTWQIFVAQGFATAIPGIIIQLILIPAIVRSLKSAKIMQRV